MNNQLYSVDNLENVWNWMERRGRTMFKIDPKVTRVIRDLKNLSKQRKEEIGLVKGDIAKRLEIENKFNEERTKLQERKKIAIRKYLAIVVNDFTKSTKEQSWKWNLTLGPTVGEVGKKKHTYTLPPADPTRLLIAKQVEWNLKSALNIREPNRNQIVRELSMAINTQVPSILIKTDLKDFYETVDHSMLVNKLVATQKLSLTTIRLVVQLLEEYASLSNTPGRGLPRGVGISSKLASFYLQGLDMEFSRSPGISYYTRFVDDILFVASRESSDWTSNKQLAIRDLKRLVTPHLLTINETKTEAKSLEAGSAKVEFLGYSVTLSKKNVSLLLSSKRLQRYKTRIKQSFDRYNSDRTRKNADFVLLSRIRFLTCNTWLHGSKSLVMTGIYCSNELLSDTRQLKDLDKVLETEKVSISDKKLLSKIEKLSFVNGFEKRIFIKFNTSTTRNVAKAWR